MTVLFEKLKQQTVTRGTCVPRVSFPHKTMHRKRIATYASFFFFLQTSFYSVLRNCKPQVTPQLSGANFVFTMSQVLCQPLFVMSEIESGTIFVPHLSYPEMAQTIRCLKEPVPFVAKVRVRRKSFSLACFSFYAKRERSDDNNAVSSVAFGAA